MLSKTATDVLSECEYEHLRMQLHQALRGNGNLPQDARVWLAGRRLSALRGEGIVRVDARRRDVVCS
ncbi:hypothetical protein K6V72_21145 [Ralstonia insidiosa]|jgi:hypothetical protein|uniref:Uncharacterized protein n=1 Tax=Ralstonia insidiosa TaxID=190721 RepID=A0A191ZXP2_9RALS|nr:MULTISPECIES: hypothetical protein [Ralstonia]ANH71525.1 hypothetical protein ACS15_2317 [Ralstonia insidiosa]ANJ72831.1 hypothetical protein A9Y76_10295 [Ralstonia insidiosa]EPX97268.1 hypothetical protein C404_14435 [Ralstonia sp. AU12-08]KAB0473392.1 hypothetical protein F7R11_12855 [Ralstonia insidiosa]MBY4704698.1 hypothetical protein [Ralstonia insidiosa]